MSPDATSPDATSTVPALPRPGERGRLDIPGRVITSIARRSLTEHGQCRVPPSVTVRESETGALQLSASVVLAYPDESVAPLMDRLRSAVAGDVTHQVGRPVGRIDLFVDRFELDPPPRPRVV